MSQTVARAIDIVAFVSRRHRTLGEIADHLGVHKSTALRILQTLEDGGFVRRVPDNRYAMGFQLIAYGQLALDQVEARTLARPVLQELSDRSGHTVHFAELAGDRVVYVDKIDGRGSVAMGSRIGLPAILHTSGVAKAILAHQPDRQRWLSRCDYERFTPTTVAGPDELSAELDRVRERGWAEDDGEHEGFLNCIALPVYDARGQVTHSLSLTALKVVAPLAALRDHLDEYRTAAHRVSRALGWGGDDHGRR